MRFAQGNARTRGWCRVGTLLTAFCLLVTLALAACGSSAPRASVAPTHPALPTQRTYTASISAHGQQRTYRVHLPAGLTWSDPRPLVLALHGLGQNAQAMADMTAFDSLADQRHFIVVYPASPGFGWGNADVAIVEALLAHLESALPVDRARISAAGFSDGGFFAEQLACQLPGQPLAAVAAVGATLAQVQASTCAPAYPVAVLLIDGTADQDIPFAGGEEFGYQLLSANATAAAWARLDACAGPPTARTAASLTTTTYAGCAHGTAVTLDAIQGGTHVWPSATLGPSGSDASEASWDFFAAHPRR